MKLIAELLTTLQNLSNDELLPVARAFSQFLNPPILPSNTTAFRQRRSRQQPGSDCPHSAQTEKPTGPQRRNHQKAVESLSLELVLTAHPTEITRRTLIHKMGEINNCLKQLDNTDIADYERHRVMRRLRQLIAQSGIRMRSASSVKPGMKPNGASPWLRTACGRAYLTICVN